MSKKTREEKKIAAYRKQVKLLQQLSSPNLSKIQSVKEVPAVKKIPEEKKIEPQPDTRIKNKSEDHSLKEYFIKDFKKSLFIISLIIALEFIVYFASIKDYLKLGF